MEELKIMYVRVKNGEYVPHSEIMEVTLVHCNIVKTIFNMNQEYYIHLFLINYLGSY